jgi:FAD/FMN-containing dehydrogenase
MPIIPRRSELHKRFVISCPGPYYEFMKAYLKELSSKLLGNVTDHPDALEHFSTDTSIFQITPAAVAYPQNTADVRKIVDFAAERTASGKPLSLVGRGMGSDQAGGPLGEGLQVVFPAHMDKLLRIDRDTVTVQPGMLYHTLQQTLHSHNRYLPAYPDSLKHTSVGGAVANDASGVQSVKYGSTRDMVRELKVVVADGSLVQTHRISARELNRKKGLTTMEGELYRKIDSLILDHHDLIDKRELKLPRSTTGYALGKVRGSDGSFDLSQIFIGAQGTLGLITEATLRTTPYNPRTTLVLGHFDSAQKAADAVIKLKTLGPSALELVDWHLLEFVRSQRPGDLEGVLPNPLPHILLLIQFNDLSQFAQKVKATRAVHLIRRLATATRTSNDPLEQVKLWKLRESAASMLELHHGRKQALPFTEDGVVPVEKLGQFLERCYKLLAKHDLDGAVWGHAGDGNLRLQPLLDLSRKRDVEKLFALNHEFIDMVVSLGGSPSAGNGEGLLRAAYLPHVAGEELAELYAALKHICDPLGIFNPGKKAGATEEYARAHLRARYSLSQFYDHVIY